MKKTVLAFLTLLTFTGFTAGVVGSDCPEGQPCIMNKDSSKESSTHQPVEKKGENWEASMNLEKQRPSANISERIFNTSYDTVNGSKTVTFQGVMETNSPAYRPGFEVNSTENGYEISIEAVQTGDNDSATAQVITENRYSIEFSATEAFQLEVNQGEISKTFEHPDYGTDPQKEEDAGLLSGMFNWLSGLFS
ncbi:hypothetical protein AQV86_03700 [Nanohaloarchaea archaeon SG9]|nr:hypothetical protein AQV86_03700 [Nanohaloarchaea archaeon SG9]